jgi:hypothetical protein
MAIIVGATTKAKGMSGAGVPATKAMAANVRLNPTKAATLNNWVRLETPRSNGCRVAGRRSAAVPEAVMDSSLVQGDDVVPM